MKICNVENRGVVALSGEDRVAFLQGLVSNDVTKLSVLNPMYACLLTPQGKFLHDFMLTTDGSVIFLECERERAESLVRLLNIYALRADIQVEDLSADYLVYAAWNGKKNEGFYFDPRLLELGYRRICGKAEKLETNVDFLDYDRHRILLGVPDGCRDMKLKLSTLLENNIDRLNGISWDKGCYTGQELTARMRYRGLLKKRLVTVRGEHLPEFDAEIMDLDGHVVGQMRSSCGDVGLAIVKISSIEKHTEMMAEGCKLAFYVRE